MSRLRHPAAWLLLGAIAACQGNPTTSSIRSDGAAVTGTPAATGSSNVGANSASGSATPSEQVLPVLVTNFPASTPIPTTPPTPPPRLQRVAISTDSILLNTPRDLQASPAWESANYPTSYQLVGMVYWSDGTYTTDVNWHSSNPAIATVDINGVVSSTTTRGTGMVTITATARASASYAASIPVTVIDFGKVQVDVW